MSENMSVYLGGQIQHLDDNGFTWRDEVKQDFPDYRWHDPLDKYNSATDAEYVPQEKWDEYDSVQDLVGEDVIVEEDKKLIDASDAMLVGWSETPSCGTPMEVMYQYMLNELHQHRDHKPIVVWWQDADESDGHISPWMEYHADHIVETREDALECLRFALDYSAAEALEKEHPNA